MRRNDREITDIGQIAEIMQGCDCCRLGFIDDEGAYILPLNFGYAKEGDAQTLYFHGAAEGKKIELIKRQPKASFEMDAGHRLNAADAACGFSFAFQCVMGHGDVSIIEDEREKAAALQCIMAHYTNRADWTFPPAALAGMTVFKLVVRDLTCKVHL